MSAKSKKFLLTACFGRVMNDKWYGTLDEISHSAAEKPMIIISLLSFGVLAPFYIANRSQPEENLQNQSILSTEEPQEQSTLNTDEQ